MSGSNESPLSRWSRRKRAARSAETNLLPETEQAQEEPAARVDADASPLLPEPETETADPAEPLPRLEDLTAESDLTAFLKKGVPQALKSAALRKMWSLDPVIRDYVGPSEYGWDFNKPGSMAGFGPLDPKETVVGFLSKTARAIASEAEPAAASSEQVAATPPDTAAGSGTPEPSPAVAEQPEPSPPASIAGTVEPSSDETEPAQPPRPTDETRHLQAAEPVLRPRHGSAMPS